MAISADEFLRRFLLHVVPSRYVRIRYYGIMANRNHRKNRNLCRQFYQMEDEEEPPAETWEDILEKVTGRHPGICPHCQRGRLRLSAESPSRRDRSPPERGKRICLFFHDSKPHPLTSRKNCPLTQQNQSNLLKNSYSSGRMMQ